MFCPNCGTQNDDNAAACQSCGQPLGAQNAAPAAPRQSGGVKRSVTGILAICASVLFGLGAVLPFARMPLTGFDMFVSTALTDRIDRIDWVIVLAVAAVGLVCALLNKNIGVIAAGVLAAGVTVMELVQFPSKLGEAMPNATKGLGFYALVIGAITMLVVGILDRAKQKNG